MLGRNTINKAALNASAVTSLVILSAEVAIAASASFALEGHHRWGAQSQLEALGNATFEEAVKTRYAGVEWQTTSNNHFWADLRLGSYLAIDSSLNANFTAVARIQNTANFSISSNFLADTRYQAAYLNPLVASASTDINSHYLKIAAGNWTGLENTSLAISEDLQINGLMTGSWIHQASSWFDGSVLRSGETAINYDGYVFADSSCTWDIDSTLAAIFTNGGFIVGRASVELEATKTQPLKAHWEAGTALVSDISIKYFSNIPIDIQAEWEGTPTKIIFGEGDWTTSTSVLIKSNVKYSAQLEVAGTSETDFTPVKINAGKGIYTANLNIAPISGATVIRNGKFRPKAINNSFSIDALRTAYTNIEIQNTSTISIVPIRYAMSFSNYAFVANFETIEGLRTCYGNLEENALGSLVTFSAVLRLNPIPASRTFMVPYQIREFSVAKTKETFEVAA